MIAAQEEPEAIFQLLRKRLDIIPWMMDRYHEPRKAYPDETYEQGPLLALHELNARFYNA